MQNKNVLKYGGSFSGVGNSIEVGDNHMESTPVQGIMIVLIVQKRHRKSEKLAMTEVFSSRRSSFVCHRLIYSVIPTWFV